MKDLILMIVYLIIASLALAACLEQGIITGVVIFSFLFFMCLLTLVDWIYLGWQEKRDREKKNGSRYNGE